MIRHFAALALGLLPVALAAQPVAPPKLVVVISVDQLSADLFAEYRGRWAGGMKRLMQGVVFPSGYQSHAATETCPGHSTILTGDHPARTGVIANSWIDQTITTRADKGVYCAENVAAGRSSKSSEYVPSPVHLLVPTLGDRMKAANPATRVVSVAGKDRAAIMMGGAHTDQIWYLRPTDYAKFETLAGRTDVPAAVARANAGIVSSLAHSQAAVPLGACAPYSRPVAIGPTKTVGNGQFARDKGDAKRFRASPESDAATVALAGDLAIDLKLGQGAATDLLIIGASATDVVGHAYGTEGSEMCLQLTALDTVLGRLLERLDRTRVDYAVVLTADHGGHDAVERNDVRGIPEASRIDTGVSADAIGAAVARELGLARPALIGSEASGDVWLDASMPAAKKPLALARAKALFEDSAQVAAAFTAAEIEAAPMAKGPPETWTLIQRARASYYRGRSGDLVVLLKPRVTPIPAAVAQGGSYIATHGSPWDYDRRVPMLFWRKGMAGFEQPNSVETVDIAPTLAAMVGLSVPKTEFDGRCLDVMPGLCRQN